jgi:hypothetical protein
MTFTTIEICAKPQFWLLNASTIKDVLRTGGNTPIREEVYRLKKAFIEELLQRHAVGPHSVTEFVKLHPESCCPIENIGLAMAVEAFQQTHPADASNYSMRPL